MTIEQAAHRRKIILAQILNYGEQGCGNCRRGLMNRDLFVVCTIAEAKGQVYEPDYCCGEWRKDMKLNILHTELQLNRHNVEWKNI